MSYAVGVETDWGVNALCNTGLVGRRFRFNAWMGIEAAGAKVL